MSFPVHTISLPYEEVAMADGEVTDVRTMRMKNMGVDGTMGFVVEVKVAGRWIRVLADGDRAQAEMVAAKARREAGLA